MIRAFGFFITSLMHVGSAMGRGKPLIIVTTPPRNEGMAGMQRFIHRYLLGEGSEGSHQESVLMGIA